MSVSVLRSFQGVPGADEGIRAVVRHLEGLGHTINNEQDLLRATLLASGQRSLADINSRVDMTDDNRRLFSVFFNQYLGNPDPALLRLTRGPDGQVRPPLLPPGVPDTEHARMTVNSLRRHLQGLGHQGLDTPEGLQRATLVALGTRTSEDYTSRVGNPDMANNDRYYREFFTGLMDSPNALARLTRRPDGQVPPSAPPGPPDGETVSVRCPVTSTVRCGPG